METVANWRRQQVESAATERQQVASNLPLWHETRTSACGPETDRTADTLSAAHLN